MNQVNVYQEWNGGSNFVPTPITINQDQKAELDYWAEELKEKCIPIIEKLFDALHRTHESLDYVTHKSETHVFEIRKIRINNLEPPKE